MSSEIKANKISPATGTDFTLGNSGDTFTVPSGATLDLAGATVSGLTTGKVLQVVQANKSDIFSTTGSTFVDVTNLSLSITPSSTSSKILVMFTGMLSCNTYAATKVNLLRGSTILGEGATGSEKASIGGGAYDATNGDTYTSALNWLDSPSSTSSLTYKVQLATDNTLSVPVYINRSSQDASYTGSSSITVMEIGA